MFLPFSSPLVLPRSLFDTIFWTKILAIKKLAHQFDHLAGEIFAEKKLSSNIFNKEFLIWKDT